MCNWHRSIYHISKYKADLDKTWSGPGGVLALPGGTWGINGGHLGALEATLGMTWEDLGDLWGRLGVARGGGGRFGGALQYLYIRWEETE